MNNIICENQAFTRVMEQKEIILSELRKKGCRITKQRVLIIDIILENECSCCKEIYYQASRIDSTIGIATVYRMLKVMEEIGAINRKNLYKVSYSECIELNQSCCLKLANQEVIHLSPGDLNEILREGLVARGLAKDRNVNLVSLITNS